MILQEKIDVSTYQEEVWHSFERYVFFALQREIDRDRSLPNITKHWKRLFAKLSERLSQLTTIYINKKYSNDLDIGFTVEITDKTKLNGMYYTPERIKIFIPKHIFSEVMDKLFSSKSDDDADVRRIVKDFCDQMFEAVLHETVHLEQDIRRYPDKFEVPVLNAYHKSLISHKRNDPYSRPKDRYEKYIKYIGQTHEIEAFALSAASKMVKEFTRGVNRSNVTEWNKAVDNATAYLNKVQNSENPHSIFLSYYNVIKQHLKELNPEVKRHEIENVWKRFFSKAYIQIQQFKVS